MTPSLLSICALCIEIALVAPVARMKARTDDSHGALEVIVAWVTTGPASGLPGSEARGRCMRASASFVVGGGAQFLQPATHQRPHSIVRQSNLRQHHTNCRSPARKLREPSSMQVVVAKARSLLSGAPAACHGCPGPFPAGKANNALSAWLITALRTGPACSSARQALVQRSCLEVACRPPQQLPNMFV